MKKITCIFGVFMTVSFLQSSRAFAVSACEQMFSFNCSSITTIQAPGGTAGCDKTVTYYFKNINTPTPNDCYKVTYCDGCKDKYSVRGSNLSDIAGCSKSITTCEAMTPNPYCPSSCKYTDWVNYNDYTLTKCVNSSGRWQCTFACKDGCHSEGQDAWDCLPCPANGKCVDSKITCNSGYYKYFSMGVSYVCEPCPSAIMHGAEQPGKTAGTGATSITQCFIPNGFIVDDDTGRFQIQGGHCYYSK